MVSVHIGTQLVREFFGPSTDRNQFLVYVDRPAGDRIDATDETVRRLNEWLSDKEINPEVTTTVAYVGSDGPRFFLVLSLVQPNRHVAFLVVDTALAEQVPQVMQRLRERFLEAFPEAAGRVKQMWMGSAEPGFVEIRLIGPDADTLYEQGNRLVDGLRAMPGTLDVRSNQNTPCMTTWYHQEALSMSAVSSTICA